MGDMSEYRGLIFCGTLLIISVFLIGIIPANFAVSYDESDRNPSIPEYIDAQSVLNWNSTYTVNFSNLTYGLGYYYEQWGKDEIGHDLFFYMKNSTVNEIWLEHGDYWLGSWNAWHRMDWINDAGTNRGTELSLTEIEGDLDTEDTARYKVQCRDFFMYCLIGYNDTYTDLENAWDNNGVALIFGIDWDQQGTSLNAFSIASSFLSFDANITGNIYVDTLIRAPVLIAGVYIAFILVLRTLGAVFGGGA